jgi:hypothetical protein
VSSASSTKTARHAGPRATKPAAAPARVAGVPDRVQALSAAPKPVESTTDLDDPVLPASAVADVALLEYSRRATGGSAIAPNPAEAVVVPESSELPEVSIDALAGEHVALIMGGSGTPIPSDEYIVAVFEKYVDPNFPGAIPEGLFTPEGLYPYTGIKTLPLNTSVEQGQTILGDTVTKLLANGNTVTIFGYSQSAILSSLEMADFSPDDPIDFVFIGNEMNPNGGFLSRFPDLFIPSLGIPFYGPTPPDSFPLVNYTLEYDGFADFPRYPLNFLSVLNAALGIALVHGTYPQLTEEQIDQAISLPTSDPSQEYYVIPTENLPLLAIVRAIPLIGEPIADLLQPALRVIVNLGYGDPDYGWSTNGFANELTTFGIFPDVDPFEVIGKLIQGVQEGVQAFIADIMPGGSVSQELAALTTPAGSSTPLVIDSFDDVVTATQSVFTNIFNWISTTVTNIASTISLSASYLYAILEPTADIVNAIVTVLPAYAFTQFVDGIDTVLSGDIIGGALDAVFMPLAAIVGLVTTALLIEVAVIGQNVVAAIPSFGSSSS